MTVEKCHLHKGNTYFVRNALIVHFTLEILHPYQHHNVPVRKTVGSGIFALNFSRASNNPIITYKFCNQVNVGWKMAFP